METQLDLLDGLEVPGVSCSHKYQIVECQGCEAASFRSVRNFSEADADEVFLYPPRSDGTIPVKEFLTVPATLRRIYRESVDAFNIQAYTLCAAGLRSIVEGVCVDHGVHDGPVGVANPAGADQVPRSKYLNGKIAGLHEKGILTEANAMILHQLRCLGNEAVHELQAPVSRELALAMQIVEHMLETLYEIPETAAVLKSYRDNRKMTC
ncbi:MAG: DUF4145 domain-containing protein [Planctomycetaceae bacterium]